MKIMDITEHQLGSYPWETVNMMMGLSFEMGVYNSWDGLKEHEGEVKSKGFERIFGGGLISSKYLKFYFTIIETS
jgi:hypothetical protein